jgi:hypothetical protein
MTQQARQEPSRCGSRLSVKDVGWPLSRSEAPIVAWSIAAFQAGYAGDPRGVVRATEHPTIAPKQRRAASGKDVGLIGYLQCAYVTNVADVRRAAWLSGGGSASVTQSARVRRAGG